MAHETNEQEKRSTTSISVVICTWNRSRLLRETLEQMTRLEVPSDVWWELIVVNNNCTDDSDSVLESFRNRLPLVRMFEPRAGKSYAANLAVEVAKGDYIVWTDDDVLVDPDWLRAYASAFNKWPEASIFAGAIDPWFEGTPPQWLREVFDQVANAYAALDHGPVGFPLDRDTYPYGANMALKRSSHLREPYDTRLGPRPNSGIRGEELMVVRRLLAKGETGRWTPEARVRHFIPRHRQTLPYLQEYFFGSGEVLGMVGERAPRERMMFGRPLWLWKEALLSEVDYRVGRLFREPKAWIGAFKNSNIARGRFKTYASARTL